MKAIKTTAPKKGRPPKIVKGDKSTTKGKTLPRDPVVLDDQEPITEFRRSSREFTGDHETDDASSIIIDELEGQQELPTMEVEADPEIERKFRVWAAADDEAKSANAAKKQAARMLVAAMNLKGLRDYHRGDVHVHLKTTVTVQGEID